MAIKKANTAKKTSKNVQDIKQQDTLRSKMDKFKDLERCVEDPCYFIKNYLYIQHPQKGRVPFKLFPFQEECIQSFLNYKDNIVVKSRQLGLSTITAAYCLWMAMFHRDKNILFMATKLETAKGMIQKIRIMMESLPPWMLEMLKLQEMEAESVRYLKLTNGSRIQAIPTSADAGRGEAISFLVIDEAAHIENFEELWTGLSPTLSTGGSALIFSSPCGKNFFYDLYDAADTGEYKEALMGKHCVTEGRNGFHAISLPWTVHPERGEEWFTKQAKALSPRAIAQELLCAFEGSSNTFFDQDTIDWVKTIVQEPLGKSGFGGIGQDLWVWKAPRDGVVYKISADPSRGDADDSSAFHVVDIKGGEIVAEYFGKMPPDRFGEFLAEVGASYNNAKIIQEKNSIGVATAIKLRDLKYPNLYYEGIDNSMYQFIEEDKLPGVTTKSNNREELLTKLEEAIRNRRIKINSSRFVTQMENFIWNGKRGQAISRKSDDLIMALAILLHDWTPVDIGKIQENEGGLSPWHQAFLKSIKRTNTSMSAQGGELVADSRTMAEVNDPNKLMPKTPLYKGVRLRPGVSRDAVKNYDKMMTEFEWVWRK